MRICRECFLCILRLSPRTVSVCVSLGLMSPGITSTHTLKREPVMSSRTICCLCVCTGWAFMCPVSVWCPLPQTGPVYSWCLASFHHSNSFFFFFFHKCCSHIFNTASLMLNYFNHHSLIKTTKQPNKTLYYEPSSCCNSESGACGSPASRNCKPIHED